MVAFEVPSIDPVAAREWCWNMARISVPFTRAAGRCFLRVSTAWFNTTEELDQIVALAPKIPFADLSGI
jgi:selenocysteine lyase/cysteine desulfurase